MQGYIAANTQNSGRVYETTDGGTTWTQVSDPLAGGVFDLNVVQGSVKIYIGISPGSLASIVLSLIKSIIVLPSDVTLDIGQQQQFTATGHGAQGEQIPFDPTWSTTGGMITQGGLYTATQGGDHTVTAYDDASKTTGTGNVHVRETTCCLRTKIQPVSNAGTATPEYVEETCGTYVGVTASPGDGWAFAGWAGAASGKENPTTVQMLGVTPTCTEVIAKFGPILTLMPGTQNPGYTLQCPPTVHDISDTAVIQISLSASPADDWHLTGVTFHTYGSGNEAGAVRKAKLYLGGEGAILLDEGLIGYDDGSISFGVDVIISAGSGINLTMTYEFEGSENPCSTVYGDFYAWTNMNFIAAYPVNYDPGFKNPNTAPEIKVVAGGPVFLGCVHNVNTQLAYGTIQTAIDDPATMDFDTLKVCPGTYYENVNVTKSLTLCSMRGSGVTHVNALYKNDYAFEITSDHSTIAGFTISGATGFSAAGIYISLGVSLSNIFGNYIEGNMRGVVLEQASDNRIGGNETNQYNTISDNRANGIRILGMNAQGNIVEGNTIGDQLSTINMGGAGILIENASGNWIKGNLIKSNMKEGILIEGSEAKENYVVGNEIRSNDSHGIAIIEAPDNVIGGALEGSRNIIVSNDSCGVEIFGLEATGNRIQNNYIGVEADGKTPAGNKSAGVLIQAPFNTIAKNVISGNGWTGVCITTDTGDRVAGTADWNTITGNYIGTDVDGETAVGNIGPGILISRCHNNTIGGSIDDDRNIISGNISMPDDNTIKGHGISIFEATGNRIFGNHIGINNGGAKGIPNMADGIHVEGMNNYIGSFSRQNGNVISSNYKYGVCILESNNRVENNYIGTDDHGLFDVKYLIYDEYLNEYIKKQFVGVCIKNTSGTLIAENILSGNDRAGIEITAEQNQQNMIFGNYIGRGINGEIRIPNYHGIVVSGSGQIFIGNHIWYNCIGVSENGRNQYEYNWFKSNTCASGFHCDGCTSVIIGNTFEDDEGGDGIKCWNSAHPTLIENMIMNNAGFGLNNLDPGILITARNNWWGDASGPGGSGPGSGDEISDNVDYSDWLTTSKNLVISTAVDTIFKPAGTVDSLSCYVQNWENLEDVIDLTVSDSLGWLVGPTVFDIHLRDSLVADTSVSFFIPNEIHAGKINKIRLTAVSRINSIHTDRDSIYMVVYSPYLTRITVSPDSADLVIDSEQMFAAMGMDSLGYFFAIGIEWTATGGSIDSTGLYTAGGESGDFIVTATDTSTGIQGHAYIHISSPSSKGDVNCDGNITPGDALCCFWRSILGVFQEECQCEDSEQAAEVNCDGSITPGDALCIFWRSILGDWTEECLCSPMVKATGGERKVKEIIVGSVHGKPGNEITVPIMIDSPHGFDAFGMQFIYPKELLEFQRISPTPLTEEWTVFEAVESEPGIVNLGGFHTEGLFSDEATTIAEVIFTCDDNATGSGEFDLINLLDDLAGVSVVKGSFSTKLIPQEYTLHQNYPNPFNPYTDIRYQIADGRSPTHTTLKIFNILGQEVKTLVEENKEPGYYVVTWDGKDTNGNGVASGIYFYRLEAGTYRKTKRMLLVK